MSAYSLILNQPWLTVPGWKLRLSFCENFSESQVEDDDRNRKHFYKRLYSWKFYWDLKNHSIWKLNCLARKNCTVSFPHIDELVFFSWKFLLSQNWFGCVYWTCLFYKWFTSNLNFLQEVDLCRLQTSLRICVQVSIKVPKYWGQLNSQQVRSLHFQKILNGFQWKLFSYLKY